MKEPKYNVVSKFFLVQPLRLIMKASLILAGGKAARFCGEKKAFVTLKGKPLLQWVIEAVQPCVDEIFLSGDEDLKQFGYPVVQDKFADLGPLAGFHSGFSLIKSEYTFVTGCDMPFIQPDVVTYLFEKARGYSCCLPREGDFFEPLCCVYRTEEVKSCCNTIIEQGKRKILTLIHCLSNPRYIPYEEIRRIDPHLVSFKNINTYEDLQEITLKMEGIL